MWKLNKSEPWKANITIWLDMVENRDRVRCKIYLSSHLLCRGKMCSKIELKKAKSGSKGIRMGVEG